MTKNIMGKLMEHLSKPMDDEPSVVYLLVNVRKLLDSDSPGHGYGALWMYCHWALHVDLDSHRTTIDFLRRVDCWITNTVAHLQPSSSWKFIDELNLFKDFIFLQTLRQQLRKFLERYGLPLSLCDIDSQWFTFIAVYSGVIEDGTLSIKSDKNNELQAVKQVIFSKGKCLLSDHHVPFVIKWHIKLKDGRTLTTSVETVPSSVGNMTAQHLELNGA